MGRSTFRQPFRLSPSNSGSRPKRLQLDVAKFYLFALVVLQADVAGPVGLGSGIQDLFAIEPHHVMVALNRDLIALPAVGVGGYRFGLDVVDQAAGGVAGV